MNKTTVALIACVVIIFGIIGIGFITSSQQQAPQPTVPQATPSVEKPLSRSELEAQLTAELPMITATLARAFPTLGQKYTVERSTLYGRGEWYGAVLQYISTDTNNRDSLRVVLQKKNGAWTLRTSQPQLLVNKLDIEDAPAGMLDDINKPAPLSGTPTSPAITPSE